ncbi:hypothetical protein B9Z55_028474 [Caenorhabditis nigoni]|uniref:ABC transporter domain-containing protein n=1 Tax=Caenorhabditis nigoni TaxID=1611254 RepID=A0A2G5SBN8_9PELO|nr:hypothetical protein B9Z55_028474 [Caenorhabditis nigoni]
MEFSKKTSLEKLVLLSVVSLTFLNTNQEQKALQCSAILYLTTPNLPRPSLNVFNGTSSFLESGKTVALVGPSKNGKSTHVILHQQHHQLWEESCWMAHQMANVHEFVTEMEIGYDAPCGEKGVKMAGGQRQRIAIS